MIKSLSSSEHESEDAQDAAKFSLMVGLVDGAFENPFICEEKFVGLLSVSLGESCSCFLWGAGLGYKFVSTGVRSWQSLRLGIKSVWSI